MSKSQRLSQSSQGTPRSQSNPPPPSGELKELAQAAVRYLLMNDYDKVPIKHSDILKHVTKNSSKNTAEVIKLATKMLREVYGLRLVVDDSRAAKQYFLINDMKFQEHMSVSADTKADITLLAIILSFLFMQTNGRWMDSGVEQTKVLNFLKLLHIDPKEHHDYFGDVKKALETYKSQRYLELFKIENTDPVKYEYHWGARAIEEVSPRAALEFASEMYGRDRIETWAAHFKAVTEFETKRMHP